MRTKYLICNPLRANDNLSWPFRPFQSQVIVGIGKDVESCHGKSRTTKPLCLLLRRLQMLCWLFLDWIHILLNQNRIFYLIKKTFWTWIWLDHGPPCTLNLNGRLTHYAGKGRCQRQLSLQWAYTEHPIPFSLKVMAIWSLNKNL